MPARKLAIVAWILAIGMFVLGLVFRPVLEQDRKQPAQEELAREARCAVLAAALENPALKAHVMLTADDLMLCRSELSPRADRGRVSETLR